MSKGISIVYDRASSKKQEQNYTRQDVKRIGFEIAKRYHYDTEPEPRVEIKSGEDLKNRAVMLGILNEIESGKLIDGKPIKAVIVPNFTRLSRDEDVIDGMIIRKVCRDNGVVVIDFSGKIYDFDKEHDQDTALIEFWFAARDKRQIIATTTRGMKEKARQGKQMGGMAPLGYRLVPTGETNRHGKMLMKRVIDPEEAKLVRRIFKLYRESSAAHAMKQLNDEGMLLPIKNPRLAIFKRKKEQEGENGSTDPGTGAEEETAQEKDDDGSANGKLHRSFHVFDIMRIVTNPIYAGWVAWNIGRAKYKTRSRYMKDLEPQMHFDASLQIVSQEEFDRVQALVKERANLAPRLVNSVYPFTYVLKCKYCGGPMNGTSCTNPERNHIKKRTRVYRCYRHWRKSPECPRGQWIVADLVAKAIIPLTAELLGDESRLMKSLQAAAKQYSDGGALKELEAQLKAELEATKQGTQRVVNSISRGTITEEEAEPTLSDLRDRKERILRDLEGFEQKHTVRKELLEALEMIEGDVEPFLSKMYAKKPVVLGRLMRMLFEPRSVMVESYKISWNNFGGKVLDYKVRKEFTTDTGDSTSPSLRSFENNRVVELVRLLLEMEEILATEHTNDSQGTC